MWKILALGATKKGGWSGAVTSAILAQSENRLAIDATGAATAVLEGYAEFLEAGGKPFILEESHPHLREMALRAERDPRPERK